MAPRVLILACGNPLRSDDGVGWHAAQLLREGLRAAETEIVSVHQLTPELAEAAASACGIIFLDAAQNGTPGDIACLPVHRDAEPERFSHALTPGQVMALCEQLYGVRPQAYMVSIAGECFDHGEGLSATVASALPQLIDTVEALIARLATASARSR